jgi:transposase, IS5 family
MLRDRYEPLNVFACVPMLSRQMDPILTRMDRLLDDDALFQAVKADLITRFPHTASAGRPSTPVEVILRMIVVKHLHGWSFPQTSRFVSDSLVLRQFCRVYFQAVPDQSTLNRWARLIQPATLHRLLDHLTQVATRLRVTQGRKLRTDGTVVETDIHHPSDSTLLYDGVRVLSRALHKAQPLLGTATPWAPDTVRERTRAARERMKRIMDVARQKGDDAAARLQSAYADLLELAGTVVQDAQQTQQRLAALPGTAAQRVAQTITHFVPLLAQIMDQTTRRVLEGEKVPSGEKIVSLFEPHTAVIRKGKAGKPTEFGRVVWLDEVEGGLISGYRVLAGNPDETAQLLPSLDHHLQQFGHPPDLLCADRGVQSAANERDAQAQGVKEVVLPKPGRLSARRRAYEQQDWFQAGRHWRAGIEGRISALKRRYGLARCRYHGAEGLARWVGWGLLAHNLRQIAAHVVAQERRAA